MNIVTKPYESLLPFLVVEAISSQKQSFNSMSVRLIDQGWAWLVSGRQLFVWRFKENKSHQTVKTRRLLSPCFKLQLPQSDVCHRADLIQVFMMPQNLNTSLRSVTVPSALVVSPEGTIRIWTTIANERFTESAVSEVRGQEFCTLAPISTFEYLLGTTTGSMFTLTIDFSSSDPKKIIICSPLSEPSGLLSGISRRMTNLFFGPLETEASTETRQPLIAVTKYSQSTIDRTGSTDRPFFVLSSSLRLRQWARTNEGLNSTNQLIREWYLHSNIQNELSSELGLNDASGLNFWPVDMITTKSKELLILLVILNTARDNTIHYATCLFNPYQASDTLSSLTLLKSHTWRYSNETEDHLLSLRFLERRTSSSPCFIYDRQFLYLVQIDHDILDAIDYGNQDDSILGAGVVDGHPILFTQRDGLIYVVPVASNKSCLNETSIQIEAALPGSSASESFNRSRPDARQKSMSSRIEPMVVELDEEDDTENVDVSQQSDKLERSRGDKQPNRSIHLAPANDSLLNKSSAADKLARKADDLAEVLKENKEFEWVQQVDAKQYGLASRTLEKLANDCDTLKDRKETLLALSKIAKLAE